MQNHMAQKQFQVYVDIDGTYGWTRLSFHSSLKNQLLDLIREFCEYRLLYANESYCSPTAALIHLFFQPIFPNTVIPEPGLTAQPEIHAALVDFLSSKGYKVIVPQPKA